MKKTLLIVLLMLIIASLAAKVSYDYELSMPTITKGPLGVMLKLDGAENIGLAGEPDLPYFGYKLLLPLSEEAVKVEIYREQPISIKLEGKLAAAQTPYPLSMQAVMPFDKPNEEIYNSSSPFPKEAANGLRTEFMNGHSIAFGAFSPFEYYPLNDELIFFKRVRVEIDHAPSAKAMAATALLKQDSFIEKRLKRSVDNSNDIPSYRNDSNSGIEYLMIIEASKASLWNQLATYYQDLGLTVFMKPMSELSSMPGQDTQEKLRNYIIYTYNNNPLRYVLLCGDTDVIPHRGFYVNMGSQSQVDNDIPADMYYSCLDGNWNTNGNAYWGEPNEADLAPELAIGRICYNNDTQINNQINKIMMYQMAPVESAIKSSFFCGEWLWEGPTWGGDYMDEMIGGSAMNGYTTVGVPADWNITKLYDRTYGYQDAWNANNVRPLLSEGPNLVNHLGHSFTNYNMRLSNSQVSQNNITNNGITQNYSIYFTQGCYAGSFDNRETNAGQYTSDCITEAFTALPTSAAGMISHSRYGWGVQGSTNGASQRFHRQYIDALFGEDIIELGYALVDCKVDNIPYTNTPVMYWVAYETNLFGCPFMRVWTDTPQYMTAALPTIWSMDSNYYEIYTDAPNATLKIKDGDELIYEGFSESGNFEVLLPTLLTPGDYQLYIMAPNFYPYAEDIQVLIYDVPYIVTRTVDIEDDDGLYHWGETLGVSVNLKNIGFADMAVGGTLSIQSLSPNLEVVNGSGTFPPMEMGEELYLQDVFSLNVVGNYPDNTRVSFKIIINGEDMTSETQHRITLVAPNISLENFIVEASGAYLMPGDVAPVHLTIKNTGTGTAFSPIIFLFPVDFGSEADVFEVALPPVPGGETVFVDNAFNVIISPNMEIGSTSTIGYMLSAENGEVMDGEMAFNIGMLVYNFENDTQGWYSTNLGSQFIDQWHRSSYRNYTIGGSYSFKFGGEGSAQYGAQTCGVLVSPITRITPGSKLKFWHWMDAENNTSNSAQAWDGGYVQLSVDGGTWQTIIPNGGYPYSITNNPASPFAAGTLVYSGQFDWTQATFELGDVSGMAQVRFVFGSDAYVGGEGWYVDDIHFEIPFVDNEDELAPNATATLYQNYPNPFNPDTIISFYLPKAESCSLDVYNLKGQLVKSLGKGEMGSGRHEFHWDGRNESGQAVASGVYSYRLVIGNKHYSKKMILMK